MTPAENASTVRRAAAMWATVAVKHGVGSPEEREADKAFHAALDALVAQAEAAAEWKYAQETAAKEWNDAEVRWHAAERAAEQAQEALRAIKNDARLIRSLAAGDSNIANLATGIYTGARAALTGDAQKDGIRPGSVTWRER